jgi:hypothetical protein
VVEVVPQGTPQQPLRGTEAVALRGVEEIDAALTRPPDRGNTLVLIELPPLAAELPRAERDRRDAEAAPAEG